jgi:hypothetical protein
MSETPTPRTDSFTSEMRGLGTGYYQAIDFARTLERENATLTKQLDEARRIVQSEHGPYCQCAFCQTIDPARENPTSPTP